MANVEKETIELKVRVKITYDKDVKETRCDAIKDAKKLVLSGSIFGYPVSANPYFVSLIK